MIENVACYIIIWLNATKLRIKITIFSERAGYSFVSDHAIYRDEYSESYTHCLNSSLKMNRVKRTLFKMFILESSTMATI